MRDKLKNLPRGLPRAQSNGVSKGEQSNAPLWPLFAGSYRVERNSIDFKGFIIGMDELWV